MYGHVCPLFSSKILRRLPYLICKTLQMVVKLIFKKGRVFITFLNFQNLTSWYLRFTKKNPFKLQEENTCSYFHFGYFNSVHFNGVNQHKDAGSEDIHSHDLMSLVHCWPDYLKSRYCLIILHHLALRLGKQKTNCRLNSNRALTSKVLPTYLFKPCTLQVHCLIEVIVRTIKLTRVFFQCLLGCKDY